MNWKLLDKYPDVVLEQRQVFYDTLMSLMETDDRILVLDADLAGASGSKRVNERFPGRMIECGIMEANMIGVSAGLSMRGFLPFVHTFAPFVSRRAADQVFMAGAYSKNTINIFASDPGVCAAKNGGTHTTFEDISYIRAIPEVMLFDPADSVQLEWLIKELIKLKGVHYIRTTRKKLSPIYQKGSNFIIGKANPLTHGSDVLLLSMGTVLGDALKAAEELKSSNISVEVADMFSIKPLDTEFIKHKIHNKKLVVTCENHSIIGGLGSCVAEVMAESACPVPLLRIGIDDQFGQVGSVEELKRYYGIDTQSIVNKILKKLSNIQ